MTTKDRTISLDAGDASVLAALFSRDHDTVTIDANDLFTLDKAILTALQSWEGEDGVLENQAAYQDRLLLVQALTITTEAQLQQMATQVAASRENSAAAEAWASARWVANWQAARRAADAARATGPRTAVPHD